MYTGSDCKLKLNKSNLITQNISNNSSLSNINHERNNIFKKQKEINKLKIKLENELYILEKREKYNNLSGNKSTNFNNKYLSKKEKKNYLKTTKVPTKKEKKDNLDYLKNLNTFIYTYKDCEKLLEKINKLKNTKESIKLSNNTTPNKIIKKININNISNYTVDTERKKVASNILSPSYKVTKIDYSYSFEIK